MNQEALVTAIGDQIRRIGQEKGSPVTCIAPETPMLGGELALDSLDLAGIVVELQQLTGKDPFERGFVEFRTVDELARLFCA
jgi:acyl carrier protein